MKTEILDNKSVSSRKAISEKSPAGSRVNQNNDDDMWIGSAIAK
jgi:hypothetical protein